MQARKRFGQNFLTDRHIIDRIISTIAPNANDHIIEIGPGHGALTEALAASGCRLDLVEIDRDLAVTLKDAYPSANLIVADVLKQDLAGIFDGDNVRVVGNLPYNISTPLLFKLFGHIESIRDMHFMLQLEVVDRMAAAPSSSEYGRLSIMTQYYCEASRLFSVPPSAFQPQPKVTSAIVRLAPTRKDIRAKDVTLLAEMVNRAFSQRRKTVRNALKNFLNVDELTLLGIDPKARPENLTLADYVVCANHVSGRSD